MRFTKKFWSGIADGSVTVAFRRWKRPSVVVGRPYRTGGGRVEVLSVEIVDPDGVADRDLVAAGYERREEFDRFLADFNDPDRELYRIEFRLLDEPDPRQMLADNNNLTAEDLAEINLRLDRLDKASRHGPWTRRSLRLIEVHPEVRAPDLAELVGRETKPFKLDIRKLKNLGLTESLRIGYRLSPRGRAYLEALEG